MNYLKTQLAHLTPIVLPLIGLFTLWIGLLLVAVVAIRNNESLK
jgi:hypothetical protein